MVIADNEGVTLVLGEAGQGQVARIRIEPAPADIPSHGSILLVFIVGLETPVRINLSTREASNLAQMLNAFAR